MKIGKKRKSPEPHIPFISLADIAWQLIIFFLLATTFVANNAMNVDIPAAAPSADRGQKNKMLTVQATESEVFIDGKPVPFDRLGRQIAELLKNKKSEQDRAVLIEGKDDLSFQRDADIMFAIQQAGGVLVMEGDK